MTQQNLRLYIRIALADVATVTAYRLGCDLATSVRIGACTLSMWRDFYVQSPPHMLQAGRPRANLWPTFDRKVVYPFHIT